MSEPLLVTGAAPGDLLLRDGRIAAVGGTAGTDDARRIDGRGLRAVPGFIELQVNGAMGCDLTADPSSLWEVGTAVETQRSAFLALAFKLEMLWVMIDTIDHAYAG